MKNKKLMLIPMLILVFSLLAGTALAAGDCDGLDTAGNNFLGCDEESGECASSEGADRDIYWVGNKLDLSSSTAGGDLLAAGFSMNVTGCDFGGSVRTAGYSITIDNTSITNNITAAGNVISIGKNVSAAGIIAAGSDITVNAESDSLFAAGAIVHFNGVVNGDASISADKVIFGDDAVITGHLNIDASEEPVYPAGIKDYTFTENIEIDAAEVAAKTASAVFAADLLSRVYWIFAMAVVALLLCLVGYKELDKSGKTLLAHPVAMPVTGLVTLCAMPLAFILLCVTAIGAPTAGLIGAVFALLCLFSTAFAGASAGRLVFPKMNGILASLIGVAAIELLRIVPFLGGLLVFCSIIYTVGYFVLACYERLKGLKRQPEAPAVEAANEPAEGGEH